MAHNILSCAKDPALSIVFALLLLLGILLPIPSGAQDAAITFIHRERALKPGEVVLLEARSPRLLKSLEVEAFGRLFPAFAEEDGHEWQCLIGIDLETKPGKYEIALRGIAHDEKSVSEHRTLTVTFKQFPTRTLTVEGKYVTPPADVTTRIEEEQKRVSTIFACVSAEKLWSGPFRAPVPGEVISAFGKRTVYNNQPRSPHTGTDFRGASGTPIRAPNNGKVVLAADLYFSGNTIILDHGLGLYSYLAHMSAFSVKEGDQVRKGEIIGKVGSTGRVTGPHLHWTVRLDGARVDPLSLISILQNSKSQIPEEQNQRQSD
jgi:murein DD-endopeptidase MepM/ murein hydrolase activator NlpD